MFLTKILEKTEYTLVRGTLDREITSLVYDSRKVEDGSLFVCISGTKIALSMKFEDQNPWYDAAERFAPGTIVTGRVARMTAFGAFVEIAKGVDALLHVSQISRNRVEQPSDVLSVGQEITAKIVDFNPEDHKISLSMKALEDVAEAADTAEAAPEAEEQAASEEV